MIDNPLWSERFWSKVNKQGADECWHWTAGDDGHGYGLFRIDGHNKKAHRVVFFLTHKRWPEPCCCHSCDNPLCVNPAHLWEGTVAENNADMIRKGRGKYKAHKGENNGEAKLTENQVRKIRERYRDSGVTCRSLASEYGVSSSLIHAIIRRYNWTHI